MPKEKQKKYRNWEAPGMCWGHYSKGALECNGNPKEGIPPCMMKSPCREETLKNSKVDDKGEHPEDLFDRVVRGAEAKYGKYIDRREDENIVCFSFGEEKGRLVLAFAKESTRVKATSHGYEQVFNPLRTEEDVKKVVTEVTKERKTNENG